MLADLDYRRLDALNGSLLRTAHSLQIDFWGLAGGEGRLDTIRGRGTFRLNRENWLKALESAGFVKTLVFEMTVPKNGELGKAMDALERHFAQGCQVHHRTRLARAVSLPKKRASRRPVSMSICTRN